MCHHSDASFKSFRDDNGGNDKSSNEKSKEKEDKIAEELAQKT
jgi:hypothetical protein